MNYTLRPAFGRDYKNGREAVAAFLACKLFDHASSMFTGGGSTIAANNIEPGNTVTIRFAGDRKAVCFTRGREPAPRASTPKAARTVPLFDLRLKRAPSRSGDGWQVTFKPRRPGYAPLTMHKNAATVLD